MEADAPSTAFDRLAPPVRKWIWKQGWTSLRNVQEQAIPALLSGGDALISARTAAGKTEAAFLPLLSRVLAGEERNSAGFALLYVAPLKALINDQYRRLEGLAEDCALPLHKWHGDVSSDAKLKARDRPSGIVMITPESMEATLVRQGREVRRLFGSVQAVVIDEFHAFIGSERGRQLLSILSRIEASVGRDRIDRIGLSATLGDMDIARSALRPEDPNGVKQINCGAGGGDLLLQIRGYRDAVSNKRERDRERKDADPSTTQPQPVMPADGLKEIATHAFGVLRGKRNLFFAGSRSRVEVLTDRLRSLAEENGLPNEFFTHHGNLARSERESVEVRLRDDPRPTTAVATSTLELGVDIGEIESVAQYGPGWSVASLRQRLGRSGRRPGKPAILRVYVLERELSPTLDPSDKMRLSLLQSIATVDLLREGWCEPPRSGGLHLSTLCHQILATIAQTGGMRPDTAWQLLCGKGPFRTVDRSLFVELLKAMAHQDARLIEMSPQGLLMLGGEGERLTASYDFFAVFQTPEEYRVMDHGRSLGTLPVDKLLMPGQTIIFGGRRWLIEKVDVRARIIDVKAAGEAVAPSFDGEGGGIHDAIAARMLDWLGRHDIPPYLDPVGRELLAEGRMAFGSLGLRDRPIVQVGRACYIFPWVGGVKLETLTMALSARSMQAAAEMHCIVVRDCSAADLLAVLREIAGEPAPSGADLVADIAKVPREKYDHYLTPDLLGRVIANDRIDAPALPTLATSLVAANR